MSENDNKWGPQAQNNGDLLSQVEAELAKRAKEAAKAKLVELVKKRDDAKRVVAGHELEISKFLEDFKNGLI